MTRMWIAGIATLTLLLIGSASVIHGVPATAPATALAPQNLTLSLILMADANPREYLFVVGNSIGYKNVESLKNRIATMPAGSTLTWSPGCIRMGDEPLLSSEKDMEAFKKFCVDHKVELVMIPSG